jgi:hypothetical protein
MHHCLRCIKANLAMTLAAQRRDGVRRRRKPTQSVGKRSEPRARRHYPNTYSVEYSTPDFSNILMYSSSKLRFAW